MVSSIRVSTGMPEWRSVTSTGERNRWETEGGRFCRRESWEFDGGESSLGMSSVTLMLNSASHLANSVSGMR